MVVHPAGAGEAEAPDEKPVKSLILYPSCSHAPHIGCGASWVTPWRGDDSDAVAKVRIRNRAVSRGGFNQPCRGSFDLARLREGVVSKVEIPADVLDSLEYVRQSGGTNLFDVPSDSTRRREERRGREC